MQRVSVLLPRPFDTGFDYLVPDDLAVGMGDYVSVPFGKETVVGVVWAEAAGDVPREKCKPIKSLHTHVPPMSEVMRRYIDWVAWYTLAPKGMVLKMALSVPDALRAPKQVSLLMAGDVAANASLSSKRQQVLAIAQNQPASQASLAKMAGVGASVVRDMAKAGLLVHTTQHEQMGAQQYIMPAQRPTLSDQQQQAADQLRARVGQGFHVSLLDGVTGSGKTEVYFEMIEKVLERESGQVLVLLPEIALSLAWLKRCEARFGFSPVLWHSSVSAAQRRLGWQGGAQGKARLVVGARSALFLPFGDLQTIIIDEEHDSSYKQEEGVMYQARDMAIARAHHEQIPVALVSATPSLETLSNAQSGKYDLLPLPSRYGDAQLPEVALIDMRQKPMDAQHWLSTQLKKQVAETVARGQQAILFLNRRGYAPLVLCRACGHRFQCPNCTAWMVLHSAPPRMHCHHCDFRMPIPEACPECDAKDTLAACGPGIERIREEIEAAMPQARVASLSSDASGQNDMSDVLAQMQSGALDILIGTQVIAKGHHFPKLTLVGVVDADIGLSGGDPRATEQTYQLLHQISGRAGREQEKGHVLIQTYQPQHPVMQALAAGDRDGLMALEAEQRQKANLPPFGRLAAIILEGEDDAKVREIAQKLAQVSPKLEGVKVLGPAPAPLARIRRHYRYRFLLHASKQSHIQQIVREWLAQVKAPSNVKIKVDIDPYSFV